MPLTKEKGCFIQSFEEQVLTVSSRAKHATLSKGEKISKSKRQNRRDEFIVRREIVRQLRRRKIVVFTSDETGQVLGLRQKRVGRGCVLEVIRISRYGADEDPMRAVIVSPNLAVNIDSESNKATLQITSKRRKHRKIVFSSDGRLHPKSFMIAAGAANPREMTPILIKSYNSAGESIFSRMKPSTIR